MPNVWVVVGAAALVAVGTYVFRWIGPALPKRLTESPIARARVDDAALLLLVGVMATSAVTENRDFAGVPRLLGVAVAGVLAWLRAPLIVVLVAAAAVDACARLVVSY